MSKRRNRTHVRQGAAVTETAVEVAVQNATGVARQAVAASMQNGLADAIGFNSGFPQNQGSPYTEQISNVTTGFKNLRWYLVSNFRQFLSQLYVEIGLVQTIVDVPVDDALRGGIEIKSQQLSEEQIEDLQISLDRDDDLNKAGQAAKWNRLFGGAGILILTDQDPETPLELAAIGPDDDLEFRPVDMWELFWDKQNTEGYDPAIQTEDFEFYNYYGEQVHKSRVMRLTGITAPSFIRPRLRGWGFSVVEALVRSMNQYLKATDLSFEVLDEFKIDIYKVKGLVNTLMSPIGDEAIKRRIQLANYQKNYQNAVVMDSEDDWDHKQLSFAGLGEAMASIRMQVASDMRMPLTKLFGISAAGFNSGEDDIEVYNAMVESQVRNKLKYHILRICEIKCQRLFGFIPDDLAVAFKPLRVMSAEQEETVKTQKFTRLIQSVQTALITSEEFRDACNKGNLFDVSLDPDSSLGLDGFDADTVDEGDNDPDKPKDTDNPGADRADTRKSRATEVGGIPKGPKKPADAPDAKAKNKLKNDEAWDESKHSRADDGKFGSGGGGAKAAAIKKKYPTHSGDTYHSEGSKDEATAKARKLREDGVHAIILHMDGPKSGGNSVYYVMVPESKKNVLIMPRTFTLAERLERILRNSAAFDRASYEADGGDGWIDPRRKELFQNPGKVDEALWAKAKEASKAAFGEERWQFVTWWYKKQGGKFN